MSSEWKSMRLGDLISIKGGMAYKSDLVGTGPSLLAGMGVVSHSERFLKTGLRAYSGSCAEIHKLLAGDLVIATRQQSDRMPILGFPAIVPESLNDKAVYAATNLYKVSLTDLIDRNFLFWLLRGDEYKSRILRCSKGTTVRMITKGAIEDFEFSLPPLHEQASIASFLDSLEDRIFFLRETNATLESIAQALFKSWFVDFDPVRAKMEGRAPEGMDEATAALFPDSFEESELGLVPKEWKRGSVYEIATITYGAPFASKLFKSEQPGKPLVRIRDLKDERPGVYTEEVHPKGYLLQPGDIAVGMDGEFRAYLWGGEEAWLNQRVCVFKPINGASAAYVKLSITPLLAAVEASETATTVIHLGKNDIDRFEVVLPSPKVLEAFSIISKPLYDRLIYNKQQAQTLGRLRDILLPRLISGQLRLSEVEEMVTETS